MTSSSYPALLQKSLIWIRRIYALRLGNRYPSQRACITVGFLQPASLLVCGLDFLHRTVLFLVAYVAQAYFRFCAYFPYQANYLDAFLQTDEADLCRGGYRNGDKPRGCLEFCRDELPKILGETFGLSLDPLPNNDHSRFYSWLPSIPSTLYHCKRLWTFLCQLFPRIYQLCLALYCSYRSASRALWSIPGRLARVAGLIDSLGFVFVIILLSYPSQAAGVVGDVFGASHDQVSFWMTYAWLNQPAVLFCLVPLYGLSALATNCISLAHWLRLDWRFLRLDKDIHYHVARVDCFYSLPSTWDTLNRLIEHFISRLKSINHLAIQFFIHGLISFCLVNFTYYKRISLSVKSEYA